MVFQAFGLRLDALLLDDDDQDEDFQEEQYFTADDGGDSDDSDENYYDAESSIEGVTEDCGNIIFIYTIIAHLVLLFFSVGTLQHSCRNTILQYAKKDSIDELPLPTKLKEFLRYEV